VSANREYVVNRFIVLSFLVMAWGYYELSGGADFVPEDRPIVAEQTAPAAETAPQTTPEPTVADDLIAATPDPITDTLTDVTRADTAALDALAEPVSATPDALTVDAASVVDALNLALAEPVTEAAAEPVAALQDTAAAPTAADLREVTGDTVNLRDGPGTDFGVLDRLTRGTVVSVLEAGPDGWVYVEVGGLNGWMSADFIGPRI
jgi:hypothetical protein